MAATDSRSGDATYYALRPRTPVRAWAIAGLTLVAGVAAVLAGWPEPRNVALVVVGALLAVAGLALAITAVIFMRTRTLHITLSPDGYEVLGPGYHKSGAWIDVDAVSATPDGSRLVIARGRVDRTFIQAPGGQLDDQMRAIADDIARRMRSLER